MHQESQTAQELLYRGLFEHALLEVHIWEVMRDATGAVRTWRLVDANPTALRAWGRELQDVVGRTTEEIFPGAEATKTFLPMIADIMATGEAREWEVAFPGTDQTLQMVSFPVGEYFVSTGFDVTTSRRQARELTDAIRSLEQATRAGGVGLWDWDLQTDVVRYSDEWKRQLGHTREEIADSFAEWRSRVHPDDLAPSLKSIQDFIESSRQTNDMSCRMRHADGTYRLILAQSSAIRDESGRALRILGSHIDVTERGKLEAQLLKSQKMESVGTLAAGIAHDFNNLLTAITGNLSLLKTLPPTDPDSGVLLEEVMEAAARAKSLTTQLLTFAKGGAPVREVASIREVITESASFVSRGSRSKCVFSLAEDLANVDADVGQISQVIDNLVINAEQAMPHGGTVQLSAANVMLPAGNEWDLAPGLYVRVDVTDEGTGIAAHDLSRIFDPFYTTKSSGSGLGLSTSYAIVAKHGGRLSVQSELGRGSTFTFLLPASDAPVAHHRHAPLVYGSGKLLVMDDDDAVRRLMKRLLERLGYRCDAVEDGDLALARYREAMQNGDGYDAVILDLTIPGKAGGQEVLASLRQLDADVVAIVASGYADDDALASFGQCGFQGRLQKPMDMATLSAEVARVLKTRTKAPQHDEAGGLLA